MKNHRSADISENNTRFIRRSFLRFLLPAVLSVLAGNISLMVDNCIAGLFLGEQELAATSLAAPVFNTVTAIASIICGGGAILASICIGEGNHQQKNRFFTLSFLLLIGSGLLLTVSGWFFLDPIVRLLGARGELIIPVKDYVRVTVLSSIALMGLYFPVNFLRIAGKTKASMIMFFIVSALDILLDILFVAVFHWGMTGLALATTLSTLIAVLCVVPVLASRSTGYAFVHIKNPLQETGRIFITGSPKAFGCLNTIIGVRVLNGIILSCGGELALAAYGCANSVNFVSLAVVTGISQTVTPIVGVLYGERDRFGVQRTLKVGIRNGLVIALACWIPLLFFNNQLAALFGMTSPEQLALAGPAIVILNFNILGSLVVTVWTQFFTTTGRVLFTNVLTFVKGMVLDLLLSLAGALLWGFFGLLIGLVLSDVVCIAVILIYSAIKKKREHCDNIYLLSDRYFNHGSYLSKEAKPDKTDITATAEEAGRFCTRQGIAVDKANTVSLGVEEIMLLMSEHAIKECSKDERLEFRLFISEHELVLRIRCFGKRFNPLLYRPENEMEFLGVKMLKGLASDVSYSTNLDLNNVLITLTRPFD